MSDYDVTQKIAANIAQYRRLNGLTQSELADCIGYSNKSVSKWERGEGLPDIITLLTISEILNVTVSELIGQTEKSKETAEKMKAAEKNKKAEEKAKKKALERAKKKKKKEKNKDKNKKSSSENEEKESEK